MVLIPRRRVHLFASGLHKWLTLFIGVQLLIWFASGALMSFLPLDKDPVDREAVTPIPAGTRFVDPAAISVRSDATVRAITLHMVGARQVADLTTAEGISLFDGQVFYDDTKSFAKFNIFKSMT